MNQFQLEEEFNKLIDSLYQAIGMKLAAGTINKDDAKELMSMVEDTVQRAPWLSSNSPSC